MMMVDVKKLTKAGFEDKNNFQCHHNNLGYCRFREKCRYKHYFDVCSKSICRDKRCPYRHPRTCKYGDLCRFQIRKVCLYNHRNNNVNEDSLLEKGEAEKLVKQVKELETEISDLKITIEKKEQRLSEVDKFISDQNNILKELKQDNLKLKDDSREKQIKIGNLNEELNSKIVEIKKLKAGLQCYKCDFQAYTGNAFIIHLSKEHSLVNEKILKCEKCDFSCTKEKELVNHRSSEHVESVNFSCTKCDFISEKKFDVDLHISTIHQDNCNALSSFSTTKKGKKSTKVKETSPPARVGP